MEVQYEKNIRFLLTNSCHYDCYFCYNEGVETKRTQKKRHAINHFYEKLLKIKDTINTEAGKKISIKRTEYMENFLDEFYKEWTGKKKCIIFNLI